MLLILARSDRGTHLRRQAKDRPRPRHRRARVHDRSGRIHLLLPCRRAGFGAGAVEQHRQAGGDLRLLTLRRDVRPRLFHGQAQESVPLYGP